MILATMHGIEQSVSSLSVIPTSFNRRSAVWVLNQENVKHPQTALLHSVLHLPEDGVPRKTQVKWLG